MNQATSDPTWSVFDLLPIGVCVIDDQFRVLYWNATLTSWTKIDATSIVEKNLLNRYPHLKDSRFRRRIESVFTTGSPVVFSAALHHHFLPIVMTDDGLRPQMVQETVVRRCQHSTKCAVISIENVSRQFRQLEELRSERHRLRHHQEILKKRSEELARMSAIVEGTDAAVISIDQLGVITTWNPGAWRLYGIHPDNALGRSIAIVFPEIELGGVNDPITRILAGEHINNLEIDWQREDGRHVDILLNMSPIFDTNGRVVGGSVIGRDNTSRREADRAIQQAQQTAEDANRIKSEFLANMSHEIRTPMTAILGFTEILFDRATASQDREALGIVRRNGEYLLQLINDILDLSKIEAGKMQIDPMPMSPMTIINDVTQLMAIRAEEKGLVFNVRIQSPPPPVISSDSVRFRQILLNLIGNAIKFTEQGFVELRVRFSFKPTPTLQCRVIDSGIGISEVELGRLFQPFTQADASTSRRFGGTGLGLTISKRLAGMLGGDLTVRSEPGIGSEFTFTMSAEPVSLPCDRPITEEKGFSRPTTESPIRLSTRVILAEDGLDNQRLIGRSLENAGATVTIVENGRLLLDRFGLPDQNPNDAPFDIVLTDVQMPEMDGLEATRLLRAAGYSRPIVAITAHARSEDRQRCIDAGSDAYISKPINRRELLAIIDRLTSANKPSPSDTANPETASSASTPHMLTSGS